MRIRRFALALGAIALTVGPGARDTAAGPGTSPPTAAGLPAVVLLEAVPETGHTDVVAHSATAATLLGRLTHAPGSARRGAMRGETALVVVAERTPRGAETYTSALFSVEHGTVTRLVGEVTNASAPLVTERGTVLVQRGREGTVPEPDPAAGPMVLRERVDELTIDAIDPGTGAARTLWSGTGQLAYLATALRGDEVLIYLVAPSGGYLFRLDAVTGRSHTVLGPFAPLARDFSYDARRDEIVFARAAAPGSEMYEVVALPAHAQGVAPRVVYRAACDHLMPRALSGSRIALSLPGDRGLGLLAATSAAPVRVAPMGDGSDAAVGESPDGGWLAVRHADLHEERLSIVDRRTGVLHRVDRPDRYTEFVGFAPPASAVGRTP